MLFRSWTERYAEVGPRGWATRVASVVREAYYRARPLLPRDVQLRLRRTFSRVQRKSRFPRWPVETAVDDLFRLLFRIVGEVAGEPVPYVAAWPGESSWALVLTHDVERRVGYDGVDLLREIELEEGYRSSWNFVPCNGYVVERMLLEQLRGQGFEIGVRGLFHPRRPRPSAADVASSAAGDPRLRRALAGGRLPVAGDDPVAAADPAARLRL